MRNHEPQSSLPGTNDDIAERVKRERALRNWSLRELERRMTEAGEPMSFSLLQRLENGRGADRSRPSVTFDQARALADVFGLPFIEFVAPAEWVRERRVRRVAEDIRIARRAVGIALVRLLAAYRQLDAIPSMGNADRLVASEERDVFEVLEGAAWRDGATNDEIGRAVYGLQLPFPAGERLQGYLDRLNAELSKLATRLAMGREPELNEALEEILKLEDVSKEDRS